MNDFTYSAIRSFNQYMNANLGTSVLAVSGTVGTLILNAYPGQMKLKNDTVTCYDYDMTFDEIGGGRMANGTKARIANISFQVDVWSPPNNNGEPRQGANRKFADRVEEALKDKVRINLIQWDGTGGTTVNGGMYVRQRSASPENDDNMDGWTRRRLDYELRAVDYD